MPHLDEIKCIEAHENEVLSIDYTRHITQNSKDESQEVDDDTGYILASASRDHLIQLYDSKTEYEPVQIIEEH